MSNDTRLPNEPSPFTARWHAYELGRMSKLGRMYNPFHSDDINLVDGWLDGHNAQRQAHADPSSHSPTQEVLSLPDARTGSKGGIAGA